MKIFDDPDYCNQGKESCTELRSQLGIAFECRRFNRDLIFHWVKTKVEKCQECKDFIREEAHKKTKELIEKRSKLKHGNVIKRPKDGETRFVVDAGNGNLMALNLHNVSVMDDWEVIGHKDIDIRLTIQDTDEEHDMLKIIHSNMIDKNVRLG